VWGGSCLLAGACLPRHEFEVDALPASRVTSLSNISLNDQ